MTASNSLKILQSRNDQYRRELKEANSQISRTKLRSNFHSGKAWDPNMTMDDGASVYSIQSTLSTRRPGTGRRPRKSQAVFQDVRKRLAEMCSESEEMSQNMEVMMRSLTRRDGRRSSLGRNTSVNFGNESFLKTMKITEITEVNEDDENSETQSMFSVQVQDEVGQCKAKLTEYRDLIREMTIEVERVDQENEGLCDEVETLGAELQEAQLHIEKLKSECTGWTKKFLGVLQELEDTKRQAEDWEEQAQEKSKEVQMLKKQKRGEINGEDMFKDFKMIFAENQKLTKELEKVKKERDQLDKQKSNMEESAVNVQSSVKDLTRKLMEISQKRDFLKSKCQILEQEKEEEQERMEKGRTEEIHGLSERKEQLTRENRELREEVQRLRARNHELESELEFLAQRDDQLGLTSQLESSKMVLDMTQDLGKLDKSYLNVTYLNPDQSHNASMFSKRQAGTNNPDEPFDRILGEPLNQEVFEELGAKTEQIEQMRLEKERILESKHEEIKDMQEKLIQNQKDFDFKSELAEKRFKHEHKMWKKEKKRKDKTIKLMEKKMVQLKIQACDLIVQKDELEISLTKRIRILAARVAEYEQDIREFNLMNKTKDKGGFWSKIF